MPSPLVEVERHGDIAVLALNRPQQRNAVDASLARALGDALEELDHEPSTHAIVVTGRGPAFCAGADLKAAARGDNNLPEGLEHRGFAGITTHDLRTPTIAAVNGPARGGGTEIALACDLVVAAEDASFGLPEVTRGILAGAGGLIRLPHLIPPRIAMELALTGDAITAELAHRWGLVNEVVAAQALVSAAIGLGKRIARNAPLAVEASRRLVRGVAFGRYPDEAAEWDALRAARVEVFASDDAKEGPMAFAEGRPPRWSGR